MKLELKHLAPYLSYGLEFICICPDSMEYEVSQVSNIHLGNEIIEVGATEFEFSDLGGEEIKPILRPLSDLTKEIEYNGEKIFPVEWLEDKYFTTDLHSQCNRIIEDERWINHCDYLLIQYLLEWHFDVFGLIEKGLAIDKNTLEK